MSKRLKRPLTRKKILVRLAAAAGAVLLSCTLCLGFLRLRDFYEKRMDTLSAELSGYRVTVYEAVKEIRAGYMVTEDMVERKSTLSGQEGKLFMTEKDMGSRALVDIPEGTQILKNMLGREEKEDRRELEFSMNLAGENIKSGDYADIRIRYPDGEDYIVISKTFISQMDREKGYLYLNLLPEEIHLMASAVVDCYLETGSYLYTARYIQASGQESSLVTYTPNRAVLDLINRDPNILEAAGSYLDAGRREALEARLKEYYENHKKEDSVSNLQGEGEYYGLLNGTGGQSTEIKENQYGGINENQGEEYKEVEYAE